MKDKMQTHQQNQKSYYPNFIPDLMQYICLYPTAQKKIFLKQINIFALNAITMSRKAINRIKVVFGEKNKEVNGLLNSFVRMKLLFRGVVQMMYN